MQNLQIQKIFLSQHAKSWYSHENIVTSGHCMRVVFTCDTAALTTALFRWYAPALDRCIPAKKRSSKRRGVIHSFLNINEFCKRIMEILVFV